MTLPEDYVPCQVKLETSFDTPDYDGIILVSCCQPGTDEPEPFKSILAKIAAVDNNLFKTGIVLPIDLPAKRFIYSPVGPLNLDYDDVRSFGEAAANGINRALAAGVREPLLVVSSSQHFEKADFVSLLGALAALYVPLEVREIAHERSFKVKSLGVCFPTSKANPTILDLALKVESGRSVARDIGGPDPERMAPPRIEEYIREVFKKSKNVSVESISDPEQLIKDYPLLAAVDRAASVIPRHRGRVVYLTYKPEDPKKIEKTLFLVGKGVTYDTGGADIKISGAMKGMSRDKCGAAAAVGFMRIIDLFKPANLKVVVGVGLVRNSVGENAYVSDEVITAKSGARVRVINTDAEGRMVMADILYHLKEKATKAVDPHLFTIATLTGHAYLSAGAGYSIAMDNGVASKNESARSLQSCGQMLGEPLEVSYIRRDDYKSHRGVGEGDDVIQAGKASSARLPRGHQDPCAFIIMASGLEKHGLGSSTPLKYTHLDIAGSAGDLPDQPTGTPLVALSARYLKGIIE